MKFSTKAGTPENIKTACVVIGAFADRSLTSSGQQLDAASKGAIRRVLRRGDLLAKRGSTLLLHDVTGVTAERVLLVSFGDIGEFGPAGYIEAVRAALRALCATAVRDALVTLPEVEVAGRPHVARVRLAVALAREAVFRADVLKSKKDDPIALEAVLFAVDRASAGSTEEGVREGVALANGMDLTKSLGNLPANFCTPSHLAATARKMAKEWKLDVEVLEKKDMQRLGMGSLLSVTRGSEEPPKLIVLSYHGARAKSKPVVLVGKGITFDSGGISLKPGEAMDEMKFDMCGAGTVLGTIRAVAEMGLKINVVGVIPTCENLPSGTASKPGDIVTSMSGQTIEILNTDAEGRLILCDALTFAARFKPAAVIDIATLTGACVVALGHINSGLFSPQDALAAELLSAGRAADDPAWRMPLDEEYQDQLKSNFADMANIGGRAGGSITAACFLSRFTKDYAWAHLDIAGTAHRGGAAKGATGRPVPLLTEFLRSRAR